MRLKDKVAIITGGASGMGAATARLFAREGAKVTITDMLEAEGQAVAAEIVKAGGAARFLKHDVADEAQWEAVLAEVLAKDGRLDVMVNNAGISGSATNDMYDTALWDRIMSVNARGVFLGTKYAVQGMRRNGEAGGSIINFSSISGVVGQNGIHCAYNASKAAVRLLTKTVAVQEGPYNIRANTVHPGVMPPMRTSGNTADPVFREKMLRSVPLRRAGGVDEVATVCLFLASDDSSYMTGTELHVDGGYLAQ